MLHACGGTPPLRVTVDKQCRPHIPCCAALYCRTEAARGGGAELLAELTAALQQLRQAAAEPVPVPEGVHSGHHVGGLPTVTAQLFKAATCCLTVTL